MLGGWGQSMGVVLLFMAPLVLIVGDRFIVWLLSRPLPFTTPSTASFEPLVALLRGVLVAVVTTALLLLPPT